VGKGPPERLDLGRGEIAEKPGEALPQKGPGRPEPGLARRGEGQALPPPVVPAAGASLDQPGALEAAQELGHRGRRHPGLAGEIGAVGVAACHGLERPVLSWGQGRRMGRQKSLGPAGDERRHPAERVGDVLSARANGRARRHLALSLFNYKQ
jgi:hypothetical protein